jgi:hypothetical protein
MSDTLAERAALLVQARQAALDSVLQRYRLASFQDQHGQPYEHLVRAPIALDDRPTITLCRALATLRTSAMRPAELDRVDCLGCLDVFTERYRVAVPR